MTLEKLPDLDPIQIQLLSHLVPAEQALSDLEWQPFHAGVKIHRFYGDGISGPSAALIQYEAGASIPHHTHSGYEHIYILCGSQEDQRGVYTAGMLVINPPGTSHSVSSQKGCLVLAIYVKPVVFTQAGD